MSGDMEDDYDYDEQPGNAGAGTSAHAALTTKHDGFGGVESMQRHETASTAVAARAAAMVQARFVMALQRPRVWEDVELKLKRECGRSGFAKVARYAKPQGWVKDEKTGRDIIGPDGKKIRNYVRGWSIEFVKRAIQLMGNAEPEIVTLYDDERKRIIRVSVIDFETNASWAREVTIDKTVERKQLKKNNGAVVAPLGSRQNNYGDTVYLYPCTEEELRMKEDRLISIYARNMGIKLIPGDILDSCLEIVQKTQNAEITADPGKARKELIEKFAELGVKAADLMEYLGGKSLDVLAADEILELRAVGVLRKEGVPWKDILAASPYRESDEPTTDEEAKKLEEINSRVQGMVATGKTAQTRNAAIMDIARATGLKTQSIGAVIKLFEGGKTVVDIARYQKEATGGLDEVQIGEIIGRATNAGIIGQAKPATNAEDKAPESPKPAQPATAPTAPPSAPSAPQAAPQAEKPTTSQKQRGTGKDNAKRFAAIAEQEGVTPEFVAACAKYSGGDDTDAAIVAALKADNYSADEPTVAAVIAALRK